MTTRMPFGKFKGARLSDLPPDYLYWLLDLPDLRFPLRCALEDELDRRDAARRPPPSPSSVMPCVPADLAQELIEAGRRAVAVRHHPDRGGDGDHLAALNDAADRLLAFFGRRERAA